MTKTSVADLSFIPIQSQDYKLDVNQAIEIIRKSGLEYEIGIISTTVRGERDAIFKLIENLYKKMEIKCGFFLDIRLSNVCGCEL